MWLSDLISELHRRSVWQVLGSYAVVAWIILQLAETLEGLIGLPLWFGPTIVVIVLLGFPVLLITTLTQGGLKRTDPYEDGFRDSAEGADPSLSSWKSLDGGPVRDFFRSVFTWRNAVVGGAAMAILLVVGTAGYSGMRSAGIGPLGSLVAKGVFDSNERLILSEFEDRTSEGTLGETVTALMGIDLGQSTSVHVLDRAELAPGLVRMQRDPTEPVTRDVAMELAQREGVKAVVSGEVLPLGPGAVVSARLVSASTGETLVALRETARTVDAVPDAVDRLSAQMRERIGESLKSIQGDPPLGDVTTGSLEALRKYVQAEWALDMGDVSTGEALVKEAIALDTTFSMAYRKLGVILTNQNRDQDEAEDAFTRAYRGRTRLPDRERLLAEAAYHTYVTEELDSAIVAYESVLEDYPSDGIAGNNLAVLYAERDQTEKAASLYVEAIEREHAPAVAYTNAAETLFQLGQVDSAQAILDRFTEAYPNHPQATQYSAAMASSRFDYVQARPAVLSLLGNQEENARWLMWGEAELASYAMIQGRLNEGMERLLRAHGHQQELEAGFTRLPRSLLEAVSMASIQLHFLEDPEGAIHTMDRALDAADLDVLDPASRGYLDFAVLYAQAGRPDRAQGLLNELRNETPEETVDEDAWQAEMGFGESAVALARGEPDRAIELIHAARARVPKCVLCGLLELGEAFEAASMPDSAAVAYQDYLDAPALFRARSDGMRLHRAVLGLARAHDLLGDPATALAYYQRQLDLWNQADPGLQPRLLFLASRIVELRAETAGSP